MKTIRLICMLMALLMLFCACNGGSGNGGDTTVPDTIPPAAPAVPENPAFSEFQLVRPDEAGSAVVDGMVALNKAIREKTGKGLSLKTDFKDSEEITYEILIGKTKREASKTVEALLKDGDYVIQTVITDTAVKIVVLGYTDTLTEYAANRLGEMIQNGEVIDESGNVKTLSVSLNFYAEYENFRLDISDPIVVFQADKEDHTWGHYQFPQIYYTTSGALRVSWSYHTDSIYDTGGSSGWAYSKDGGDTWIQGNDNNVSAAGYPVLNPSKVLMSNGKYFAGFMTGKQYGEADYILKYANKKKVDANNTSGAMGGVDIYMAKDIPEYQFSVQGKEYNPATGQTTAFDVTFNWPYMPLTFNHSYTTGMKTYISPTEILVNISNYMGMISTENGLYYCTYSRGFNSAAASEAEAVGRFSTYYSVYVFHSADNGRTWNYMSQVSLNNKLRQEISSVSNWNNCEGFCEPSITVTRDGTFVMLLRTGSDHPSYIVQSKDGCKTWSEPVMFDECGVLPQLLTLDCGVTLATYGRPKLFVRATNDPDGKEWQEHVQIQLSDSTWAGNDAFKKSCYYTFLVQTGPTSAILVYSDFNYPNAQGQERRTILIRKINVVPVQE